MDKKILDSEFQNFIIDNIDKDVAKLALQKNPFPEIPWLEILNQIAAKSKAKEKLPTFFNTPHIIFPNKISVEQSSSEKTAWYKSTLISGNTIIDLTGGFGVDDFYFSKKVKQVIHCEINNKLSEIVEHNFDILNASNIQCIAGDSLDVLEKGNKKYDWIYIDPSRRNDAKGKVFMLKDCLPNVPELLDFYFSHTENILIKTAPILDISAGLSELSNVKYIHVVAIDNEVKELLWELSKDFKGSPIIKTINFNKGNLDRFDFELPTNGDNARFGLPKKYLYEPNSAIMKSGGFDEICSKYNIDKLHPHSHLYTTDKIIEFPGRVFEIEKIIPYNKTELKIYLENKKANITTRNFPDTVEIIRKKWKIKDGGNMYCFFTTDTNNHKIVLICAKIN
ncbi:class I SAM-dependent methyltransferase [Flavobacterium sp. GT3R68]|uniref:class I SAM-dependent methyltransferase n=1 Tax=Flavobacterium sp. GT3R68 TaxID=2594437 RepID=UPI000F85FF3D|nr:class I SAM-dependent methyltransferase [Flavobacterium sp. GT3R68]RTY93601.1 class I SAM-dependent methyltransferase [Flavobacterium sp. GSN2]TRW91678.1 class I SAM-dependent methyltransferase [Flavobacterium sp. GT3R68]